MALRKLGFLTIGLFDEVDPRRGHESTLEIIVLGERLGFDSAWVRHRHLQYGISSPVAVLAAATQRTSRIELAGKVRMSGMPEVGPVYVPLVVAPAKAGVSSR